MDDVVYLEKLCPITKQYNDMELPLSQQEFYRAMEMWKGGALIQTAFPTLTADQREFIKTGIMPDTWEKLHSEIDYDA